MAALHPLLKLLLVLLLLAYTGVHPVLCCYTTIFNFGDSLADTGNLLYLEGDHPSVKGRYPYGMTYFHHPTGRCSDGRLIIDFIAQFLGVPLLPPYLVRTNEQDFRQGANFAVAGATALEDSFYEVRNIENPYANYSLSIQVSWFQQLLPSLCNSPSDCREFFSRTLFIVGEFGGDDYYHPVIDGISFDEIRGFVPLVVNSISKSIQKLIELGAQTLLIPGNIPVGCSSVFLTVFENQNKELYNPKTGCLNWLNDFSEYHNTLLQTELDRLRRLNPHTTIIYGDYFNTAMLFYNSPSQFGFPPRDVLIACCGGGGPYNFNFSAGCGKRGAEVCDDPSLYVNWDGLHLTEAAYKIIATHLLYGSYTIPPFNNSCLVPAQDMEYVGFYRK